MANPEARVAKVLDPRQLVLNRGFADGFEKGRRFVIFQRGEEVTDPETGESLGAIEIVKGTGSLIQVQERLSILRLDTQDKHTRRTLSEIMSTLSGLPDRPEEVLAAEVGDYARPEQA